MKRILHILALPLLLVSMAAAKPVSTDTEAVDAFRAVWRQSLGKQLEARPFFQSLKAQVFEDGKVTAKLATTTEVLKQINSTLTEKEEKELILFGKKDDLKPDREVWLVKHVADYSNGFEAVIDAEDGDLLFFWITPEG